MLWHLKHVNPLLLGILFKVLSLLLLILTSPSTFGSLMRRLEKTSQRTSSTVVFIWNARLSCRTLPKLIFPDVIRSRGWASLLKSHLRCPVVFILEFYSIIHDIDTDVPQFVTTFKGTHIVVTPESYIRGTTCSQGNTS